MTTINNLTAVDAVSAGDAIPIYSAANGDARRASLSIIAAYIQTLITSTDDNVTFYSAPSATGFTVTLTTFSNSVWLILTPVAGYAAGTILLPPVAYALDNQEIMVNSTQAITTLTVSGNGATVTGAPTTMAANAFFKLRYNAVLTTWYRVA
jgi:hypothetical protein